MSCFLEINSESNHAESPRSEFHFYSKLNSKLREHVSDEELGTENILRRCWSEIG